MTCPACGSADTYVDDSGQHRCSQCFFHVPGTAPSHTETEAVRKAATPARGTQPSKPKLKPTSERK